MQSDPKMSSQAYQKALVYVVSAGGMAYKIRLSFRLLTDRNLSNRG